MNDRRAFAPSSSPRQISLSYQPPITAFPRPYFNSMSMPDLSLAEMAAKSSSPSVFPAFDSGSPPPASPPQSPETYSDAMLSPEPSAFAWLQPQVTSRCSRTDNDAINPFQLDLRSNQLSEHDVFKFSPPPNSSTMFPSSPLVGPNQSQQLQSTSPSMASPRALARTSYYTLVHPNRRSSRSPSVPSHDASVWHAFNEVFDFSPSPSPQVGRPSSSSGPDALLSPPMKHEELFSPEQLGGVFPDDIQYCQPRDDPSFYVGTRDNSSSSALSPTEIFSPSSRSFDAHIPGPSQPPSLENSPAHVHDELPSGDEPIQVITRKSRGRQVPNVFQLYGGFAEAAAFISNGGSKDPNARTAICFIPNCGACFVRNEHLKRHLISIHSQDKPWYCPYPKCGKNFNRRDNLAQHMHTAHVEHGHKWIPVPNNPYNCPFSDVLAEIHSDESNPKVSRTKKAKGSRKGSKYVTN